MEKNNSRKFIIIGSAVLIILLIALFLALQNKAAKEGTVIQGNLRTTEVSLNSTLPGKILEVCVSEGDEVAEGETLVIMDSQALTAKKGQALAALDAANSQYESANAQYEKAKNGARSEEVIQAQAAYELAKKTYDRMDMLYREGAVSESAFDQAAAQYTAAAAAYDMAQSGARREDVAAAKSVADTAFGIVKQAEAALAEVESYLEDSTIKSPTAGTVTGVNVNPGELVSTGMPLVTVASAETPWVEVYVPETEIGMVRTGNSVKVSFLAYPGEEFDGTIVKVNRKPDFATKRATSNSGEFDILSYGVKIEIGETGKELFPGMTVIVDFGKDHAGKL